MRRLIALACACAPALCAAQPASEVPPQPIATKAAPPPAKPRPPLPKAAPAPPADDVAFAEAEQALKAFEAIHMPAAKGLTLAEWTTQLQTTLSGLATRMTDLHGRYGRIAGTAHPSYAVPALVRMGEVIEKFAAEIEAMPVHPELAQDAQAQMREALHQAAEGMRVGARSAYQQAVQRAQATGFEGEWLDFAKAAVQRLPSAVKPR